MKKSLKAILTLSLSISMIVGQSAITNTNVVNAAANVGACKVYFCHHTFNTTGLEYYYDKNWNKIYRYRCQCTKCGYVTYRNK